MPNPELINVPDWVSVVPATVPPGQPYWRLTRLRYENEQESGGRHHIYVEEPHDPSRHARVHTGTFEFDFPLEKPASEPAGNYAMVGIPNIYSLWMVDGPSDRVEGLQMRGNRHVCYYATYERAINGATPPPPPDLASYLRALGQQAQLIQFNPTAALQRQIFADGFVPNSPEFAAHYEERDYVAQRAERLDDGRVRIYYVSVDDWSTIHYLESPAG